MTVTINTAILDIRVMSTVSAILTSKLVQNQNEVQILSISMSENFTYSCLETVLKKKTLTD